MLLDLYFAPLSCSLASRIALYEAGMDARFHQVALATKQLPDGSDYRAINPKGQVPALRTDEGAILTEGPAVLQYIADRAPDGGLAPPSGTFARAQLQQWLNYIGTELHKAVFYMMFRPDTPPEMKAFARNTLLPERLVYLETHLAGRETLLDTFSVADAYLVTVLGWVKHIGVDLAAYPAVAAYDARMLARPALARAVAEEAALRAAAA
jgi:glutathione S-transferase